MIYSKENRMSKNLNLMLIGAAIFNVGLISGCAHGLHSRGSVAVKHSDTEADVCLGEKDVKAGDKVALYRNHCKRRGGGPMSRTVCTKVQIGEGQITKVLGEHYSSMSVPAGIPFDDGTLVEKR